MGLFDKVKNILFDEEEVEIPIIKKEEPKNEEENPIKEIKIPKDDFSDKENYKSESTFTFPIDFDDEEEFITKEEEKPIVETYKETYKPIKKQQEKRDYSDFLSRKEEKKQFKPTPIISPVYGILDQNYKKDDVIVRKDILRRPNELSLDEVRKKAFGSLEDEIDANLIAESDTSVIKTKEEIKIKKEQVIEKKPVIVEEPVDKLKTIGELIEEDNLSLDVPEIDELVDTKELDSINIEDSVDNNIEEEYLEPTNTIEDILEDVEENSHEDEIDEDEEDLFSLIDSMYEEKGE